MKCSPTIRSPSAGRGAESRRSAGGWCADVSVGRPVEVGRPATGEAGLDRGRRAEHSRQRGPGRLEIICDAYLSVSTPVQVAAPTLMAAGGAVRDQILERITQNDRALRTAALGHPAVEVLETQAGWSTVIRVPSTRPEEDLVIELIDDDGVIVHPGFFFDFPHEAFVVVSLLPEPQTFAEGIGRLLERVDV